MDFEYVNKNNNQTSRTVISSNGPISNLISGFIAFIVCIVCILIFAFIIITDINDNRIKKLPKTNATVLKKEDGSHYKVRYTVNDKIYEEVLFTGKELEINDEITIHYEANKPNEIYDLNESNSFKYIILMVLLLLIISSILSTKKHITNFLHYINPSKYELDNTINNNSIGSSTISEDENGTSSNIRF